MFPTMQREPTLSSRVAAELEAMIMDGRLQPGEHLPSVPLLAEQFGVSRTVIREAIQMLIGKDLLDVRHGSGTLVRRPSAEFMAQSMRMHLTVGRARLDYRHVIEVRHLLEVEIAGLAALRRTDEDLRVLAANLEQAAAVLFDLDLFARKDVEFHAALARATHNPLYAFLLDSIADVMITVRNTALRAQNGVSSTLPAHRAIFERVCAGDSKGAAKVMQQHLVEGEAVMRAALQDELHADPAVAMAHE